MKIANKIFGGTEMTWRRVILTSLFTGVAVGLLMCPGFLEGTSLRQPGISYEFWILFALYISLNCEKPLEAGLKTFVAFVISQPVIYLVQVPFSWLHWQIMSYYPTWVIPTLLTLPGGAAAWYVKKGNRLSVLILSAANLILCVELPTAVLTMISAFPKLLLSVLFIVFEIVFFILLLFRDKKKRAAAFIIAAVMLCASAIYTCNSRLNGLSTMSFPLDGSAPYELISENELFDMTVSDDGIVISYNPYALRGSGSDTVVYRDGDGNIHELEITYSNGYLDVVY